MADVTNILNDALTYNGHRYYIYSDTVAGTWEDAKAFCEARGGHLAVITDATENNALFNCIKTQGYDSAYFGLSDATAEGTWTWVNGESVNYTNWHSGEPSNGNKADKPEDYGMFYWKFTDGTWNDGDFTDYGTDNGGHAFICEWDTADTSQVISNYNGHTYQLFDSGMTWDEAKAYCESLDGHLVTITDSSEQSFVESLLSNGSKNSYWLGGFKDDNGSWQWTTDEPFSYQKWGGSEPNNHNGIETALMIYKGRNPITGDSFGRWNDLSSTGICYDNSGRYETFFGTDNFGFICEWDTTPTTGTGQTISNYMGEPVTLSGSFMGATFSGNNFVVNSSAGTLTIQNVVDKVVDLRNSAGNEFVKAYKASAAGVIDGRGIASYEIIEGSSAGTDVIFAGDGGSQIWGGSGTAADALVGGLGTDIFIGGRYQGADNFYSASSADFVNLTDATLSDIVAAVEVNGNIAIGFNTGNIVTIQSTELLSAAVNLADGSSWRFNHVTKSWQSA